MKKLAFLTAGLICFAGCARNSTNEMTATEDTNTTAVGTPASGQSGTAADTSRSTPSLMTDTNSATLRTNDLSTAPSVSPSIDTNKATDQPQSEPPQPPPIPDQSPQTTPPNP